MQIEKIFGDYQRIAEKLRCPTCGRRMRMRRPASAVCKGGHCFDLSRQGYVNFLPLQKHTLYSKELFDSRRAVFAAGFYEPLAACIHQAICESFGTDTPLCVLDAGCGEGYYDRYLQPRLPGALLIAFDNVKEAVGMGAKSCHEARWLVADLTNVPLQSGVADVILDIFTPSNYAEFARLLAQEGRLIKVIPGEKYLGELREAIWSGQDRPTYSPRPVAEYLGKRMKLERQLSLRYERAVDADALAHFLRMSPMMFGRQPGQVAVEGIASLTFDFTVLIGKK